MGDIVQWPGQVDQDTLTLNFLEKVLPPHGLYCARSKHGRVMVQTFHETIEGLWTKLRDEDRGKRDVYFAVCSFSSNDGSAEACAERKSLEIDVDFGAGHARPGYTTFEEARDALKNFCIKAKLPVPIIVKSGGGFHAYWPLKEAISRAKWQRYANGLKLACLKHGLKADHSLTINPVHILRPPGTSNRKLATVRPVELDPEWLANGPYDLSDFDALLELAADNVVRLKPMAIPPKPESFNGCEYPEDAFPDHHESVGIELLASVCGVVAALQTRKIRETRWKSPIRCPVGPNANFRHAHPRGCEIPGRYPLDQIARSNK